MLLIKGVGGGVFETVKISFLQAYEVYGNAFSQDVGGVVVSSYSSSVSVSNANVKEVS